MIQNVFLSLEVSFDISSQLLINKLIRIDLHILNRHEEINQVDQINFKNLNLPFKIVPQSNPFGRRLNSQQNIGIHRMIIGVQGYRAKRVGTRRTVSQARQMTSHRFIIPYLNVPMLITEFRRRNMRHYISIMNNSEYLDKRCHVFCMHIVTDSRLPKCDTVFNFRTIMLLELSSSQYSQSPA